MFTEKDIVILRELYNMIILNNLFPRCLEMLSVVEQSETLEFIDTDHVVTIFEKRTALRSMHYEIKELLIINPDITFEYVLENVMAKILKSNTD